MKKSLFILATLAMSSALYGQTESGYYTREKVLDLFAQYNPAVLENARQNSDYNAVLESFLSSYQKIENAPNRYELIAIARNFDNSIRLKGVTLAYENAVIFSQMSGGDIAAARVRFHTDLLSVFQNIWAVTVHLREYEITELEEQLKSLRKDTALSAPQKEDRKAELKEKISVLKQELKKLQKNIGEQILAAVDMYVAQSDQNLAAQLESMYAAQAQTDSEEAHQSPNLQIKTKNKKPVAK